MMTIIKKNKDTKHINNYRP